MAHLHTPEPFTGVEEAPLPSPPRPRLRLKRRNVPHLSAPTQHFLASVAAADVPIPSIEEPEIATFDSDMSGTFAGMNHFPHDEDMTLLRIRGRTFSPPKTPAPGAVPSLSPSRYPNWSIDSAFCSSAESSPDPECSSRPSTARSTQTSSSLFSRLSQSSDDEHCLSPEVDGSDRFTCASSDDGLESQQSVAAPPAGHPRRAPWTKAMSSHLWATYVLYLQDPKVTPFRIGKSLIPPPGVCVRVAREAKRSWRGAKALGKASASGANENKSGSTTPTAESCAAFMEWPHTCAGTRAHLRELCRLKAATPGPRGAQFMSRSPTPFTQAANRHWNRRSTPARSPSVFNTGDMAISLSVSTSETMQPEGPLAQLTSSSTEPSSHSSSFSSDLTDAPGGGMEGEPSFAERRRLGSPFSARSYGPSSSSSLAAMLGSSSSSRQSHTIGPRRTLQSPVRLSRSATQKRRTARQSHEPRKRPSLASDIFTEPSMAERQGRPETQFSSTTSSRRDALFIPRTGPDAALTPSSTAPELPTARLAPPAVPPPRLGSPFSGSSTSFSVPNRFSQPATFDLGSLGRPFATVQRSNESTAIPARTNLASRLAYIDQRLKEFNNNRSGNARPRSDSPL